MKALLEAALLAMIFAGVVLASELCEKSPRTEDSILACSRCR